MLSADHVAWARLGRSGLVEPVPNPRVAAESLIGVQAQVLASAGLALSARVTNYSAADLARDLYDGRTLVKLWGQRRTLHLYAPDDWSRVYALFRDRKTWTEQATERIGGDLDTLRAAVRAVESELRRSGGTISRRTLLDARPELRPYLELGIGMLMDLVQMGTICHARPVGSESHFAHRDEWLPGLPWDPPSRDEAGVEWTRRYLATYGPATPRDVAFWLGESAADVRRWVQALEDETAVTAVDGVPHLALRSALQDGAADPPSRASWPVRLLHRYDPILLAHRDKSWLVDEGHYKRVWRHAGIVEAVLLVRGRIAGVWRYKRRSRHLDIRIEPFGRVTQKARRAIESEAERVARHFRLELGELDG